MQNQQILKKGRGPVFCLLSPEYNDSPIRQEIIALIRLKGGKANYYDENGRRVGEGNGDLNH